MSNPVQKIQSLKNTSKLNDFKFPKTLGSDEEQHFTYFLVKEIVKGGGQDLKATIKKIESRYS